MLGQPEVGCGFEMSQRASSCCEGAGAVCGAIPPHPSPVCVASSGQKEEEPLSS